ncbi:BA14K family protein [Methylobacterium fujisawaense]|uniref:BA14K family protein n=1 Tax=Methylobacterium fujisawaense TaxID=107400 RepID=UPI0031F4BF87
MNKMLLAAAGMIGALAMIPAAADARGSFRGGGFHGAGGFRAGGARVGAGGFRGGGYHGGAVVAGRGHYPGVRPGYGYGRRYGYGAGAAAAGVGLGLAAGGLGYGYPGYDDNYAPTTYAYPESPTVASDPAASDATAYCQRRFRSYDPASGTYLGYDGLRRPCP